MRNDYQKQIDQILNEAWPLPHSPARLALLEQAIQLADTHQDRELGFELREELAETATFTGHPEKLLVAFSWRLAQCDHHPEEFCEDDLLWQYKWVMDHVHDFPQISRTQIEDMLEDMTRRYKKHGLGLRAVYKLRFRTARDMGDEEGARKYRRRWQTLPIGAGNDCPACELNDEVRYYADAGRDEQAIDEAKPILKGRLTCGEIPHLTLARLLMSFVRLDRADEAEEAHKRGYRLIKDNLAFLPEAALHLEYLVHTGQLPRAVRLFEKHLPWALETRALARSFEYYLAALRLFGALRDKGKETLSLRLPTELPIHDAGGTYALTTVSDWVHAQARDLAEQFDARNGNDYFSQRLAEAAG